MPTPYPCVGTPLPFSRQQGERDVQGDPTLSPLWSGTQYVEYPEWPLDYLLGWRAHYLTMASSSQLPKIKINGSDELESRAQKEVGVPQGSPLCVCVYGWGATHLPLSQQRVGLLHWGAALGVEGLGGEHVTLFIEGGALWSRPPASQQGCVPPDPRRCCPTNAQAHATGRRSGPHPGATGLQRRGEGSPRGASWRKSRTSLKSTGGEAGAHRRKRKLKQPGVEGGNEAERPEGTQQGLDVPLRRVGPP